MKKNNSLFIIIFILLITPRIILTNSFVCLEGMIGKYPAKVYWLMQQLYSKVQLLKNCAILYGPPGNGKTTLARKIAQAANCNFISFDGPSVVESYVGQGARNIAELFNKATEVADKTQKRTIIFIDEIDAIASNIKTEFRSEHKAALQQLWLELDRCKNDNRVFILFATNHLNKLDKTFLDRFGNNAIEIKNPDDQMRASIIQHYFSQASIEIDKKIIDMLVRKTKGLSIRCIEDMINDISVNLIMQRSSSNVEQVIWDALRQAKTKFENSADDEEKNEKYWYKINLMVSIVSGIMAATLHAHSLYQIIRQQFFEPQVNPF